MTFIIAEVGSNFRTVDDCLRSVDVAKECGADAVKFQAYTHGDLYGPVGDYGMKMAGELTIGWLSALRERADAAGLELMCTAFSPDLVRAVDPFVSRHKVASSDLNYPQLLHAVAKAGKPAYLSTGAADEKEIELALGHFGLCAVTLMYCVAAYPAAFADLAVMEDLRGWPVPVGFSDHTLGISMAVEASRQGATAIEKHFTAFPDLDTPDRPHSVKPNEFKRMVDAIRGTRKPCIGPTQEEVDMLLRHKRRLVATRAIPEGGILKYGENFGAFRSLVNDTRGLSPHNWAFVNGKAAARALAVGEAIGAQDWR